MKISKQAKRDAKQLFNVCVVDGVLADDRVRQAVSKVIEGKPRGYVGILHHFQRLMKLDIDKRTAKVESAAELTGEQQAVVQSNLEKRYGGGLKLSFSVNPTLIGGLRIQIGSDVYDGSVHGRLMQLKNSAAL
ncbi:MAG: ATP synthase F1 subunit delta [Verrucomicrobiia bacterium]|jgi:F-type H+-transporting ATPase subunit delta